MSEKLTRRSVLKGIGGTGIATVGGVSVLSGAAAAAPGTIPKNYLAEYKQTGKNFGLDWTYLAGIGWIESHHGQLEPGCEVGPPTEYGRAKGPMQFIPPTWETYGKDYNGDGEANRCDYQDAIPAAAQYLVDNGAPENWHDAIYAYNHSEEYVNNVIDNAAYYRDKYGGGSPPPDNEINMGDRVVVTPADGLNTHKQPGLESPVIKAMPQGTEGEIMNGPVSEDGYTWWGVHWLADDIWGWSAGQYLKSVSDEGDDGGNGQKPSVEWIPAYEGNYENASRGASGINWVVIHTIEGPASAGVSVFQNPDSNVSAHYIVAKSGHQIQMVHDEDIAWHAGGQNYNTYSIGLEHGGHAGETNFSNPQYKRSAEITRYIADQYGVPLEHPTGVAPCDARDGGGIIGHHQVPEADCGPNDHTDPGSTWEWDRYMNLVRNSG